MGLDPKIAAAQARTERQRYVEAARRASQADADASGKLCAAHAGFVRTMLRLGHPSLALDAAHALLAARPECPHTRALVERLRSEAKGGVRREILASSPVRNVSI